VSSQGKRLSTVHGACHDEERAEKEAAEGNAEDNAEGEELDESAARGADSCAEHGAVACWSTQRSQAAQWRSCCKVAR
jgi:hypothetical protein